MRFSGRVGAMQYDSTVPYESGDYDDPDSDEETDDNAVNWAKYEMSSVIFSAKKVSKITSSRIVYSTPTLIFITIMIS